VIRTLAPLLLEKGEEPAVLAVAEDGSAVVPLLGGLGGVNVMAREIAAALNVAAAITTSGELRFGTCLLNPPSGYELADLELGKRFVSDLLAGESVRIEGTAPWLDQAHLPEDQQERLAIHVGSAERVPAANELLIYPKSVSVTCKPGAQLAGRVRTALSEAGIAVQSLACLLASDTQMAEASLHDAALELGVALRFVNVSQDADIVINVAEQPLDLSRIGRPRGRLAVIGLGPGAAELMVPAVKAELARCTDVLGYETYVRMAGPFRDDQVQRARHAFELAAEGRSVVVVSSGDPGVFAMAAAVIEALHESSDPAWHQVDLEILPGVSASLATAAQAGAPLGHDFCVMSLSDNLKPWSIIEKRLDLASQADLALAFYNPISRSRPWQLGRALEIVALHRTPETPVVLGRDIGRPGQTLRVTTLGQLTPE
jgi:cobalt-precorrin 5A hydrolase/precorrin-3B C17-methyltransferase